MSTPQHRSSSVEVDEHAACMCAHGDVCSSLAPGHSLHLIQARLAAATPSDWVDGIVQTTDAATGVLVVHTLGGESQTLWSAAGAALEAEPGSPVALHRVYHVLAVGRARFNVASV